MPHKGARKVVYPIPDDWLPHDGGQCPVYAYSYPGVAMRDGTGGSANGMEAHVWQGYAGGSCWEWAGREPRGSDIVAYTPGTKAPLMPRSCRGMVEGEPCGLHRGHTGPCEAIVAIPYLSYDASAR